MTALHNETRKYSVLDKRFAVLNQNHEELIKIKDECKTENEKLRIENGHLKKENEGLFGSLVEERFTDSAAKRRSQKSTREISSCYGKRKVGLFNITMSIVCRPF